MVGRFRFFRTADKKLGAADISVESKPNEALTIRWRDKFGGLRNVFGDATEAGIREAEAEHRRRGGVAQSVEIVDVIWLPADTTADAMQVAATIAAWKSWGGHEADVQIVRQDNQWRVVFI